jgi:hypothetical protein
MKADLLVASKVALLAEKLVAWWVAQKVVQLAALLAAH